MGVQFHTELAPVLGYVLTCCDGSEAHALEHGPRYSTYEQAREACAVLDSYGVSCLPGCEMPEQCGHECARLYVVGFESEQSPLVDLHTADARYILEALEYQAPTAAAVPELRAGEPQGPVEVDESGGTATAEDFLGRVLIALARTPVDEGRPASVDPAHPRHIEGARNPGRFQVILDELHNLAEWCRARDRLVQWQ